LVTTGGGALPLPTCAQPVMLRKVSTAAEFGILCGFVPDQRHLPMQRLWVLVK
jgi:hypothetical protein